MKTKLSLVFLFVALSATTVFSQNNEMKARMEYEDAEAAYSNGNYSIAIEHLENIERLLRKPTAKTRYLLILSLSKNLSEDYEYKDLEKLRNISKHYLDNYTTDTDKYRDVYDLSNKLKDYPKSQKEHQLMLDIKKENERKRQEEEQNRKRIEEEINMKKRQNFLSFNLFDFHEDGKYLEDYKRLIREKASFKKSYKYKDHYVVHFSYGGKQGSISFNRNKISYYQIVLDAIEINGREDFERKVKEFADKYAITPEKESRNSYRFEYKHKVVLLIYHTTTSIMIHVKNRNYEIDPLFK